MGADGLITRRRDPDNRRVHVLKLTAGGEDMFKRLRAVASSFDKQLRRGVNDDEVEQLRNLLDRLAANAGGTLDDGAPWAGLAVKPWSH